VEVALKKKRKGESEYLSFTGLNQKNQPKVCQRR